LAFLVNGFVAVSYFFAFAFLSAIYHLFSLESRVLLSLPSRRLHAPGLMGDAVDYRTPSKTQEPGTVDHHQEQQRGRADTNKRVSDTSSSCSEKSFPNSTPHR